VVAPRSEPAVDESGINPQVDKPSTPENVLQIVALNSMTALAIAYGGPVWSSGVTSCQPISQARHEVSSGRVRVVRNSLPAAKLSRRETWMLGLRTFGQIAVSMAILGSMYFLVPTKDPGQGSDLPWLLLDLGLFAVVVAIQVPAIIHAKFPILRAAITLGVLVPFYLLVFARLYLSSSLSDSGAFNESLDLATALYFTVTVFATVGFGDIVAKSDSMRMVVTAQMLINLVVVGAFIRVVVSAARRGVETRVETRTATEEATDDPQGSPTSTG
jgi:hypothetical protein